MCRLIARVWLVIAIGNVVVSGQPPATPTFRSVTVLTELDVLPVGHDGALVRGLTAVDFEVVEDGVPQVVDSVEFVDVDAAPTTSLPPGATSNAYRASSRVWVLVVDDLRTGRALQAAVRSALSQLVEALSPGDFVALVPTSGRQAHRVEFTRDKADVLAAVRRLTFAEAGVGQRELGRPGGSTAAWGIAERQGTPAMRSAPQVGTALPSRPSVAGGTDPMMDSPELSAEAADDRLLTTLADVSTMIGRTSASRVLMVVVSSGLPVSLAPDARRVTDQSDLIEGLKNENTGEFSRIRPWDPVQQKTARTEQTARLVMTAQRGGVTVYGVNPMNFDQAWRERLLAGQQTEDARERLRLFDDQANPLAGHPFGFLGALSTGTGGVTFTGLIDPGVVARALRVESGQYYLVRYYPSRQTRDDTLREVRVRVRRPGVTVRARTRYATNTRASRTAGAGEGVEEVLRDALPRTDLPLEMRSRVLTPSAGRPALRIAVRIVPDGQSWHADERYEVAVVAIDRTGRLHGGRRGSFAGPASPDIPRGGHLTLDGLRPGRYQVRVAVRDVLRDKAGSVFAEVHLP